MTAKERSRNDFKEKVSLLLESLASLPLVSNPSVEYLNNLFPTHMFWGEIPQAFGDHLKGDLLPVACFGGNFYCFKGFWSEITFSYFFAIVLDKNREWWLFTIQGYPRSQAYFSWRKISINGIIEQFNEINRRVENAISIKTVAQNIAITLKHYRRYRPTLFANIPH